MNLLKTLSLLLVLTVAFATCEKATFHGYKLLRITLANKEQGKMLNAFEENSSDFDIWATGKNAMDVLLSPVAFKKYSSILIANQIEYVIVQQDIQKVFDEQQRSMIRSKTDRSIIFKYARYSEILSFIEQTVSSNPSFASTRTISKTLENRNIQIVKLRTAPKNKALWIDCGIHAREWVTPSSCVYIIDQLIKDYNSNNADVVALFNKYEVHIIPLLNPDGYEYSHSTYRMWRKNRKNNSGSSCVGVDLNRNSGFEWSTGGSSTNPCSDIYAGPSADSEIETKAYQSAINEFKAAGGQWDAYISIHSYGLWWFTPWGAKKTLTSDYDDLYARGKAASDASVALHGKSFKVGSSANLLYINSGSTQDWARGAAGIKYSYTLELRPGQSPDPDAGYGFALPENQMPQVATETYAALMNLFNGL